MDVDYKLQQFAKITGAINRTSPANKDTLAISTLAYGSEVWVIRKRDQRRIIAGEMKFVRRTAGVTLLDKIRTFRNNPSDPKNKKW